MIIDKEKGFVSPHLNESLGFISVKLQGTGRNNTSSSRLEIDGQNARTVSRRGMTVFLYNENMTFHSVNTFDTFPDGDTNKNALSSFLKNMPPDKYMFITTFNAHGTNSQLTNTILNLGGSLYTSIPFDEEYNTVDGYLYNKRTPYCAIGNTNIGIVYESIGTPLRDAENPNAVLDVTLPELEYMGVQGYGDNLLPFSEVVINDNEMFKVHTVRGQLTKANQCYKINFMGKVTNQNADGENGCWVRVDVIDNNTDVIKDTVYNQYLSSRDYKKYWGILPAFGNDETYRLTIVNDFNSEIHLRDIELVKSSVKNPVENKLIARFKDNYISSLNLRNSSFGIEPFYATDISEVYNSSQPLFTNSLDDYIYDYFDVYGRNITSSVSTSRTIQLEGNPSGYVMNCFLKSGTAFKPSIEVEYFDSSNNSLLREKVVEFSVNLPSDTTIFIEHFSLDSSVNNISDYDFFQNVRFVNLPITVNKASTIPNGARTLKYHFTTTSNANYNAIFPCVNAITPLISKRMFISPASFNLNISVNICNTPTVLYRFNNKLTLEWDSNGYEYQSIHIYRNGVNVARLASNITSWEYNAPDGDDISNYDIYFITGNQSCLADTELNSTNPMIIAAIIY